MIKTTVPVVGGWRLSDIAAGFVLALFIFVFGPSLAWAQDATPAPVDTTVSLKSVVDIALPYIVAALGALLSAALTVATNAIYKWTGFQVEAKHREALHSAAMTAAATIWAKADAKIADMSIDVKSPLVKAGVDWVLTVGAPKAVESFGLTPEQVADLIASKLGVLQAEQVVPPAEVAAPAA